MSHLTGAGAFTPSLLPASFQLPLHADGRHFAQLISTVYPFPPEDRWLIAQEIHKHYLEERHAKAEFKAKEPSHQDWDKLNERFCNDNADQADDIPRMLVALGLWFRKSPELNISGDPNKPLPLDENTLKNAARLEHDRWVASKRSKGFIQGEQKLVFPRTHPCIVRWDDQRLDDTEKEKDIAAINAIPRYLAAANYEVIKP
jgi:hypothetical protein